MANSLVRSSGNVRLFPNGVLQILMLRTLQCRQLDAVIYLPVTGYSSRW